VVPGPIAATPGGNLLVYDFAGDRVLELVDGKVSSEVSIGGHVTALSASPSGGFFAALGRQAKVLFHDASGRLGASWALSGNRPESAWPVGLVVEPGGDVAIVDRHGDRVLFLDAAGRSVGVGSRRGWEPGLLISPRAIARLDDGRLIIADEGNGRVQLFRRIDREPAP
jgi:hypothetical protein